MLGRAFFQARTRLKGLYLAGFGQNIDWISQKMFGAHIGLSSKQAWWPILSGSGLSGLNSQSSGSSRAGTSWAHSTSSQWLFQIRPASRTNASPTHLAHSWQTLTPGIGLKLQIKPSLHFLIMTSSRGPSKVSRDRLDIYKKSKQTRLATKGALWLHNVRKK